MEPEGSVQCSQKLAIRLYPEPNPQAEGSPLVGCPHCLFNVFAVVLHI
jgi:hypothetical protein